jgi:hypothetical protein
MRFNTSRIKDLTGQTFNDLKIIGRAGTQGSDRVWDAECICGKKTTVTTTHAVRGRKKSCGCLLVRKMTGHIPSTKLPLMERDLRRQLKTYKTNARLKGREWGLTNEKAFELFKSPCHWCGEIPTERPNGIDRAGNSHGYTLGNCLPCCRVCNYAKKTMTGEEFLLWIERAYEHTTTPLFGLNTHTFLACQAGKSQIGVNSLGLVERWEGRNMLQDGKVYQQGFSSGRFELVAEGHGVAATIGENGIEITPMEKNENL